MYLTYVAIAGASYLIGSLPTAYLLVKWKTHQDVRKMGSGNVGALNSYEVTRSKFVGVAVLVVDLLKGVLAVTLTRLFVGDSFLILGLTVISAVIGHNYPLWLSFRGGRGLATAAGALLLVNGVFVVIWGVLWSIAYLWTKNVHKGNIAAIALTPFISAVLSSKLVEWGMLRQEDSWWFILFGFLLCVLLFLRHLQPLKEIFFAKSR